MFYLIRIWNKPSDKNLELQINVYVIVCFVCLFGLIIYVQVNIF